MSIPTNIVEGREQDTEAGFARYLKIALASAAELDYHLIAAGDMKPISRSDYMSLSSQVAEVRRMLHGLLKRLEPSQSRRQSASRAIPK